MKTFFGIILLLIFFQGYSQTYQLYQTKNIHNQLKLNTKTGEIYQVQDDGQTFLVTDAKTPDNNKENKYTLQKTENIWTFIMLDQFSGKLWQCQFSVQGSEYRSSWEINPNELYRCWYAALAMCQAYQLRSPEPTPKIKATILKLCI
jgi:hypothetical protein